MKTFLFALLMAMTSVSYAETFCESKPTTSDVTSEIKEKLINVRNIWVSSGAEARARAKLNQLVFELRNCDSVLENPELESSLSELESLYQVCMHEDARCKTLIHQMLNRL